MDWIPPLITFGASLFTAVVSATLAVRLALKRFYSEKWWERKSSAYTKIIEALHHLREHADTNLTFSLLGRDLPPEGEQELTRKLQEAMAELRMQRDIGSFVIAEEAVKELNKLFEKLDESTREDHWQGYLDVRLAAIDLCLPELRRIARTDLALGGFKSEVQHPGFQ